MKSWFSLRSNNISTFLNKSTSFKWTWSFFCCRNFNISNFLSIFNFINMTICFWSIDNLKELKNKINISRIVFYRECIFTIFESIEKAKSLIDSWNSISKIFLTILSFFNLESISQRRIIPSSPAVAKILPSGENLQMF